MSAHKIGFPTKINKNYGLNNALLSGSRVFDQYTNIKCLQYTNLKVFDLNDFYYYEICEISFIVVIHACENVTEKGCWPCS